jgi:ubiquinone biosynthesis protein
MLAASSAQVHLNGLGNAAVAVSGLLLILALGWAARRLLGLPVGTLRTLVAGLIGAAVAQGLDNGLQTTQRGHQATFFTVVLGVPVLVAMVFIVVSEALVPAGTMPGPVELARLVRRRMIRTRRYSQITRIAVRHGLGPYLRGRRLRGADGKHDAAAARTALARSLRQALEEAGPTFVKLGQLLSTRRDLLPAEFVAELARLQDRASPAAWDQIAEVLRESLGSPPAEVFAEFGREPVAAASIAQVHRARLRGDGQEPGSGAEVAVKVQRPGIQDAAERDLDIVQRLAVTLEQRTQWARGLGAVTLAGGFATALREELDFRVEARNTAAATASWSTGTSRAGEVAVLLPGVHLRFSTERLLVTGWLDGVTLGSAGPVIEERGLDRIQLARTLLRHALHQITVDGIFHADPHPGNIMLLADGRLAWLDLGSVGRLDAQLRSALQNLLLSVARGEPAGMADALLDLVNRPDEIEEQQLERALGQFMALHLAGGAIAGTEMFTDLFRLIARFELGIPPEVAAVFRALATLEGTLTLVAPGFDLIAEAQGFASGFFAAQLAPGQLRKTAADELVALLPVLRRLPRRLDRISGALEEGRLGVNVRLFADRRDRQVITGLLHQTLLTGLGAVTGLVAAILLVSHGGPQVAPALTLFQLIGYNLLVVSAVLVLRVLFTIFRADRLLGREKPGGAAS